jgi:simple sugar transport system substrate-binding protein
MVMYVQMGGNAGDGATWARTNGALAAGEAFGIKIIEQYSAWQPEKMLEQFRQAVAAKPDCIEIMGHPGNNAFEPLVKQAREKGILITVGNSPLTKIQKMYGSQGTGYAGVDLYTGGAITASKMLEAGLKSGDKALVYGLLAKRARTIGQGAQGDAREGRRQRSTTSRSPPKPTPTARSLCRSLTAYLAKNPDVKGIGTQHGGITSVIPKALQSAGKKPGEVIVGGIDLSPATIDGLQKGWITATLDQQLYLQGLPAGDAVCAVQALRLRGVVDQHRRRRGDAEDDQGAGAVDRERHSLRRGVGALEQRARCGDTAAQKIPSSSIQEEGQG